MKTSHVFVIAFIFLMNGSTNGHDITSSVGIRSTSDKHQTVNHSDNYLRSNDSILSMRITSKTINNCSLIEVTGGVQDRLAKFLDSGAKMITHQLIFQNYTTSLLNRQNVDVYRIDRWTRITDRQGLTLLGLPFNFGMMSLTTLTIGVHHLDIELREEPEGCFLYLSEMEKIKLIRDLLMNEKLVNGMLDFERVCYQIIEAHENEAIFADMCCQRTSEATCRKEKTSLWLQILGWLLLAIRVVLFLLGPLALPKQIYSDQLETLKYVVRLVKPITKTLQFSSSEGPGNADIVINLRKLKGFPECRKAIKQIQHKENWENKTHNIVIDKYELHVNHRKLVTEEKVPVGLFYRLRRVLCHCKVHYLPACRECCRHDALGRPMVNDRTACPWKRVFRPVGKMILVLLLPLPYYIRLMFYFFTEEPEIAARKAEADKRELVFEYGHSIIGNLSPLHPIWIIIYFIYFISCFILLSPGSLVTCFKPVRFVAFNALNSMHNVRKTEALDLIARSFLWPVKRYGIMGIVIGVIYWPFVIPLVVLGYLIYLLPSLFLTFRILIGPAHGVLLCGLPPDRKENGHQFSGCRNLLYTFSTARTPEQPENEDDDVWEIRKCVLQVLTKTFCFLSLWALMIAFMVCAGFLIDIFVYALMGILANAGVLLRYVTVFLAVALYSHEIFKDVRKAYITLNRAIFDEVSKRVEDSERNLEENQAFRNPEPGARGAESDMLVSQRFREDKRRPHWRVEDLLLFVDSTDMYRIPRKLFDEACSIKVAGAPGPLYLSHMRAIRELLIIICFLASVMFIMLALGEEYGLSNTSTTLVTVVGGFLPYMLRVVLKPKPPNIQLNTVCFQKQLDSKIMDFRQKWPLHDLPFRCGSDTEPSDFGETSNSLPDEQPDRPTESVPLLENGDDIPTVVGEGSRSKTDSVKTENKRGIAEPEIVCEDKAMESTEGIEMHPLTEPHQKQNEKIDILIILPKEFKK